MLNVAFWKVKFTVNGRTLGSIVEQSDLGVQVYDSIMESQIDRAAKKAFGMLAFISQGIGYRSWEVMLQKYRTLVRPHLFSFGRLADVIKLERVQKRFTRMLPGFKGVIGRDWAS